MAAATNYEIYTQDGRGNWTLHARYPGRDREDAMEEAKEIERLRNIPVRVIKEVYYPENNTTEENIIYSGRVRPRPETSGSLMKAGVAPVRHASGNGQNSSSGKNSRSSHSQPGKPANKTGDFIFRLSMVLLLSALIAIVGTGIASLIMKQVAQSGLPVAQGTQSMVLFGVFVGIFLLSAVPMVVTYVPLDTLGDDSAGKKDAPARKTAPRGSSRSATEAMAERVDRNAMSRPGDEEGNEKKRGDLLEELLPDDEAQWPALKAVDPKKSGQKKKKKKAEDTSSTTKPEVEPATAPGPSAKIEPEKEQGPSPDLDKARLESMKFLGSIIESIKTSYPNLDAYNRFGLNLYLSGACEHLSQSSSLQKTEQAALTRQALEIIGTKPEQTRQLIQRLDTYRQEARYRTMIAAGVGAMRAHLAGQSDPLHALGGIMKQWNTPQVQQLSTSGVTIMFTDMANSTSMTQELGDAAAQDVIRAHNTIVRNALAAHRGKEVKHTGDGIMATFDDAIDAVRASIEIQEKADEHTAKWPRLALRLRIGMNSGEPIVEENDYFGATVQIAARVCASAGIGQIWLGESTKELIPAFAELNLVARGAQALKGVTDPVELFEVVYNSGQSLPESGPDSTGGLPEHETRTP